jgi:hypothetical protein
MPYNQKFLDDLKKALNVTKKQNLYTSEIHRKQPTAFIFLLDQSGSMNERINVNGVLKPKSELAAFVLNETLNELLVRATKASDIREYYDISIIGYGMYDDEANIIWDGNLSNQKWVSMTELSNNYISKDKIKVQRKTRNGITEEEIERKIWVKPMSANLTPMYAALKMSKELLEEWLVKNSGLDCYPPTIINITDGEASDAEADDLIQISTEIKDLYTQDGNCLLYNIHISESSSSSIIFPENIDELPIDEYAHTLYNMSSDIPERYNTEIAKIKSVLNTSSFKAMCFNADAKQLVNMMNIGTSQTNKAGQNDL